MGPLLTFSSAGVVHPLAPSKAQLFYHISITRHGSASHVRPVFFFLSPLDPLAQHEPALVPDHSLAPRV